MALTIVLDPPMGCLHFVLLLCREQSPEASGRGGTGPAQADQHRQVGARAAPVHQHAQCQHQVAQQLGGQEVTLWAGRPSLRSPVEA